MSSTYVIAEPGSTHGGDLAQMRHLIAMAKGAGADAVKFQWLSKAERLCERRQAPEYLAAYKLIEFPRKWLAELRECCADNGLDFMCTVYLPEDLEFMVPLVKYFKIASFEALDDAFLKAHNKWSGVPVILSTGMLTLDQAVSRATLIEHLGGVLHCVSAYPTPIEQVHLDAIYQLRKAFAPVPVGFSDHTRCITTGGLAVAAGAQILEVHVRLEGALLTNADYTSALGPSSFADYVAFVRRAEQMVGTGVKRPQPCEEPMMSFRVKP